MGLPSSTAFLLNGGVKQGCLQAPTVFGIFFNYPENCNFLLRDLLFVDQSAPLTHAQEKLESLMNHLLKACDSFGLSFGIFDI